MKDDFSDFLNSEDKVPPALFENTLKYLEVYQRPKKVLFKYYVSTFLGALLTLIACPQYGFGPVGGELGLLHYVMDFGPVWCGIFCAAVFMAGGNFAAMIFLNVNEIKWISSRKYKVSLPFVSVLFFFGMIGKYYAPGDISHYTVSFHFSWLASALFLSVLFLRIGEFRLKVSNIKS